jgi:hypothetical protein
VRGGANARPRLAYPPATRVLDFGSTIDLGDRKFTAEGAPMDEVGMPRQFDRADAIRWARLCALQLALAARNAPAVSPGIAPDDSVPVPREFAAKAAQLLWQFADALAQEAQE